MSFQINALAESLFRELATLSDVELSRRACRKMTVDARPGFPCRVSLVDAEIGETVFLVNYEHQPNASPYRACHAIFVRTGAKQAKLNPGEIPKLFKARPQSVRAFDRDHMMIAAELANEQTLRSVIMKLLADPDVEYLHLHNAKPGCYNASVVRA